jgi:putative transcriptional regulator
MSTKKIKDNLGDLLIESMEQALAHAKGKITLKTERIELPEQPPEYSKSRIKKLREKILKVSQPVFASILGCTPSAVKSWEQGDNRPNGPTRRLMELIEKDPGHFLELIKN